MKFVGRYFDETTLLQTARAWERAAGTDKKNPAMN
jgi:Asp-tRNA(Asn)/Glu-tRNA(Gln) amidotransferase A subunit family amidase